MLLVVCSPVVSSRPNSFYPDAHFAFFPLQNPGIVSVPAGFPLGWLGWLGTVLTRRPEDTETYEKFEVRSMLGVDQAA